MSNEAAAAVVLDRLDDANLFTIDGPIVISYSRSSITGAPLFSYRDAQLDLHFSGTEITRTQTTIGELVTVTLEDVVDAFRRTFTLLVPTVRLCMGDEADFDTVGIDTTDRSGAFVPAPGPSGVLQTSQVHDLRGVAQRVAF